MSKSIKVLLLTLLALCLTFSAAFAADGTPLTINLDAGKAAEGSVAAVNVLTGKGGTPTGALTFTTTQNNAAENITLYIGSGNNDAGDVKLFRSRLMV